MPVKIKEALKFISEISEPPGIFFHKDADGCISASLFMALLKTRGIKPSLDCGDVDEDYFKKFSKTKCDTAIFLDFSVDNYPHYLEPFKGRKMMVIDHHKILNDLNEMGIVYVNPRFDDPEAYISTSQLAFEICSKAGLEGFEWLMRIGAAADRAIKASKEELEAANLIDAIKSVKKESGLLKLPQFLVNCKKIEDFLYEERFQKVKALYDNEIEKQMRLFEAKRKEGVNWISVRSRYGLTGTLCTLILDAYPDITVFTYSKKADGSYNISGRSKKYDMGKIFSEASKGIGQGGGHVVAAGGNVSDIREFKRRAGKMLS